jgi:acetyl esterase/lipase
LYKYVFTFLFFSSTIKQTQKKMTAEIDNRPIHPVYKVACDESRKRSPILVKVVSEALETKDYSQIQAFRAAGDEQLSKIPLPDIIKTTKEVTGGPDNIKVKLSIYSPTGSGDEVLPIILYLHGGGFMFGSTYTHGKSVVDVIYFKTLSIDLNSVFSVFFFFLVWCWCPCRCRIR